MNNENVATTPLLFTPSYFSSRRRYLVTAALPPPPVSWDDSTVAGERRQQQAAATKTIEEQLPPPYKKQREMSSADNFEIRKKKNENKDGRLLLTPGDFVKLHKRVSKPGEKGEFIPRRIEPCEKCENIKCITGTNMVRTGCYCSDILQPYYLTQEKSDDDIYMEMTVESDLPW